MMSSLAWQPGALDGAQGSQIARNALEQAAPENDLRLTLPFPADWPPSPDTPILYFAYYSTPLPTGEVSTEIHSPAWRIQLSPPDGKNPRVDPLHPRRIAQPEYADPFQSLDELEQAATLLLGAVSAPEMDPNLLLAAYRTWLADHSVLGSALEEFVPSFLAWLRTDLGHP